MKNSKWLPWALLALFALAAFSFGNARFPLTDHDEALYSSVSRELLSHSDWWTLYWQGKPWFIHAPMSMWIQAAFFKLFGVSEFTARLHPVVFGTGLVLLTAAFGTLLFRRRTGLTAGLILASSPLFFGMAHLANLDMPFAFFITLAIYLGVRAVKTGNKWLYPAFWLSAGLATLCKGLWGTVLVCMVLFLYTITSSERRRLWDYRLYISFFAWIAAVAPWLWVNYNRWGNDFLEPVIATNTYQRLTTAVCDHTGPWWFYIAIIIMGFFPWSFLGIKAWFTKIDDSRKLLLLWIIPAFLLHSIAKTKLPNYMLPLFPPVALMLAAYFSDLKSTRIHGYVMIVLSAAAALGFIYGLRMVNTYTPIDPTYIAMYIGFFHLMSAFALIASKKRSIIYASVFTVAAISILPILLPGLSDELLPEKPALQARQIAGEENPIIITEQVACSDGIYYYSQMPFLEVKNLNELVEKLPEHPNSVLILSPKELSEFQRLDISLDIFPHDGNMSTWIIAKPKDQNEKR